jgi:hypothetical protein
MGEPFRCFAPCSSCALTTRWVSPMAAVAAERPNGPLEPTPTRRALPTPDRDQVITVAARPEPIERECLAAGRFQRSWESRRDTPQNRLVSNCGFVLEPESMTTKDGFTPEYYPMPFFMRIPGAFGHRFRFDPDRIPADVGQRSGVCRTGFRRHPDSNPERFGQCSDPVRTAFRGIRTVSRRPSGWVGGTMKGPLVGGDAER